MRSVVMRGSAALVVGLALAALALAARAQERFSLFVPTEQVDVRRMLELAGVREGDVVVDLGSGDGRIVLEAARLHPAVRGRGIEIDEKLVRQSREAAQRAGLADRVEFVHQNAFDADLRDASVIAMWLWPEVMRMLRPKILAEARPGTRVVARLWDFGTWRPDAEDTRGTPVFLWIVPAKVEGYWDWELDIGGARRRFAAVVEQRFQAVEGVVRAGDRRGVMHSMTLAGERLSFSLLMTLDGLGFTRLQFDGAVSGDAIEGTAAVLTEPYEKAIELPWRARRVPVSAYFAPTGVDVK